jgi:hypothetical protein
MLPHLQILNSKSSNLNGLMGFDGNHLGLLGDIGVPLDLLVLESFRYLGRGWTSDDLEDVTGIGEEVHRHIFIYLLPCVQSVFFQNMSWKSKW